MGEIKETGRRQLCLSCKWRTRLGGGHLKSRQYIEKSVACFYSIHSGKGCARKKQPDGSMKDLRGDDPDACLLYEEGDPPQDQKVITIPKWEKDEVLQIWRHS